MSSKYFNKNKFWYGHKAELLFEQSLPGCKKQVAQADYGYKDLQVEIGRSKFVSMKKFKVYFRKLFYNIHKEHHDFLKGKNPHHVKEFVFEHKNDLEYNRVPWHKFVFIYFTNKLQKFAIFTYEDMMDSELKKGYRNEYSFDMKVDDLYNSLLLQEMVDEYAIKEYINNEPIQELDLGEVEFI